ncbi:MAG: transposase [bacterium]
MLRNVKLLTYCITSNHVHVLLKASAPEELARFMQRVAGGMAQAYNQRKRRSGAFWSDRYHAAMIEDGEHLWRCMRYIDEHGPRRRGGPPEEFSRN